MHIYTSLQKHVILTKHLYNVQTRNIRNICSGGSKGVPPAHAPPRPKIFSISCSFWEIFGKIVGWRPLLRGILEPPLICNLNKTSVSCSHQPSGIHKHRYHVHIHVSLNTRGTKIWSRGTEEIFVTFCRGSEAVNQVSVS